MFLLARGRVPDFKYAFARDIFSREELSDTKELVNSRFVILLLQLLQQFLTLVVDPYVTMLIECTSIIIIYIRPCFERGKIRDLSIFAHLKMSMISLV